MITQLLPAMTTNQTLNTPSPQDLLRSPIHMLAFGFGSGLAPKAPGTFGTLVGIPFFALLVWLQCDLTSFLLISSALFLVGIPICDISSKKLHVHDHPGIVWDEIVGYLFTMAPVLHYGLDWRWLLVGFAAFRFFDILKPWPIKWADERAPGGFGIMVDDLIAAIFAAAVVYGVDAANIIS